MGQIFSSNNTNSNNNSIINNISIENIHVLELKDTIELIKKIQMTYKDKAVDMNNYTENLQKISIKQDSLIPMTIELLYEILNKNYIVDRVYKSKNNKLPYIPPRFNEAKLIESFKYESLPLINLNQYDKPVLKTVMLSSQITLEEFNNAFTIDTGKRDMIGMTKDMLKMMTSYYKNKFIGAFNTIYESLCDVNKIAWGKASFIYKNKGGKMDEIESFRQIIQFQMLLIISIEFCILD